MFCAKRCYAMDKKISSLHDVGYKCVITCFSSELFTSASLCQHKTTQDSIFLFWRLICFVDKHRISVVPRDFAMQARQSQLPQRSWLYRHGRASYHKGLGYTGMAEPVTTKVLAIQA